MSPVVSSKLKVVRLPFFGGGTAALGGTLVLAYEPGIYSARNYTLLSATNGVTGAFSTVTGSVPTAGLAQSVSVSAQTVDLVLSPISSATGTIPSETVVVAPTNDTVFSAVTTTAILNGQWANRMLLDRWGSVHSSIANAPLAGGHAIPSKLQTASADAPAAMNALAASLPEAMTGYGGWFWGTGNFASLNGSAVAPGSQRAAAAFLPRSTSPSTTKRGSVPRQDTAIPACRSIQRAAGIWTRGGSLFMAAPGWGRPY